MIVAMMHCIYLYIVFTGGLADTSRKVPNTNLTVSSLIFIAIDNLQNLSNMQSLNSLTSRNLD